jgi:hypothetical protein
MVTCCQRSLWCVDSHLVSKLEAWCVKTSDVRGPIGNYRHRPQRTLASPLLVVPLRAVPQTLSLSVIYSCKVLQRGSLELLFLHPHLSTHEPKLTSDTVARRVATYRTQFLPTAGRQSATFAVQTQSRLLILPIFRTHTMTMTTDLDPSFPSAGGACADVHDYSMATVAG